MRSSILLGVLVLLTVGLGLYLMQAPDDTGGEPTRPSAGDEPAPPDEISGPVPVPDAPPGVEESAAASLHILVLDDLEAPASGARVVLVSGETVRDAGLTDGTGRVTLAAPGGDGVLWVRSPALPVYRCSASLEPGDLTVRLPAGEVVDGSVLVNGENPREPVRLRLYPLPRPDGAPGPVLEGGGDAVAVTDGRGGFQFGGLPVSWNGRVAVPLGYEILEPEPEGRTVPLSAPTRGLRLSLFAYPRISGRVPGVPGAKAKLEYRDERGGGSMDLTADENGRFRGPVRAKGAISTATLTVTDAEGHGRVTLDLDPARLREDLDLGDIDLGQVRAAVLVVTGPDGLPVVGAVAVAEKLTSPPTDEAGVTNLDLPASIDRISVGCVGLGSAEVLLPDRASGRIPVSLPGGNRLEFRFVGPDDAPVSDVHIVVSADAPMFAGPEGQAERVLLRTGASPGISAEWGRGRWRNVYRPDSNGCVVLAGIAAEALSVQVIDRVIGSTLAERSVTIGPRDHRVVEVRLDTPARTLAGRVVDEDGEGVAGAEIRLARGWCRADKNGRFRAAGLRVSRLPMVVRGRGMAPYADPEFEIPADGEEITIPLRKGHLVEVSVVTADGRLAEAAGLRVEALGRDDLFEVEESSPGVFRVGPLPAGPARLIATFAGAEFGITHDSLVGKARIVVPLTGAVHVRIRLPLEKPVIHRIRLEPSGEGRRVCADVHYVPGREDWEVVVPAALPGVYRVHLDAYDDEAEERDTYIPVLGGPEVRVIAGKASEVVLAR